MTDKFVNLKKEYREFVKKTAKQIRDLDINSDLTKTKCQQVFTLYQSIFVELETMQKININDINHIILNYNKEDTDVELLKKFIKIKNLHLIKTIIKSSIWPSFINKLILELDITKLKLEEKKQKYLVERAVYKLLNQTINEFRGCWEIAEFKDNKLKKLEIIEPEHYEFLKLYIKSKIDI
jgi:hypothetical protein